MGLQTSPLAESSPLPHGIAALAWDRRQFRTESPFWPGIVATPTRNSRSCLESSTVPHRIAVVPWDRRQSHTESPFWPGIGDSPTRNRRSGLGSATVPHGTAALAWDRFQSRTECVLWPRGGAQKLRGRVPRRLPWMRPEAPPCHVVLGARRTREAGWGVWEITKP